MRQQTKFNDNYLVNISTGWFPVKGKEIMTDEGRKLLYFDPKDKQTGNVSQGHYIPHFPRQLSAKEKGIHLNK